MHTLQIPDSCYLANSNVTATGHAWGIEFESGDRATVTATDNPNGSVTYRIQEIIHWFGHQIDAEEMIAKYADQGNWEQEK